MIELEPIAYELRHEAERVLRAESAEHIAAKLLRLADQLDELAVSGTAVETGALDRGRRVTR